MVRLSKKQETGVRVECDGYDPPSSPAHLSGTYLRLSLEAKAALITVGVDKWKSEAVVRKERDLRRENGYLAPPKRPYDL